MDRPDPPPPDAAARGDFIREIVRADLAAGRHGGRVATRFPPEPNGYLHIGHAKSICLNFGIAREFAGLCNLRMDDTNPETEDLEYVEAIQDDVRWLGFAWDGMFHASDYFEPLYEVAVRLVRAGKAYVDELSEDEIRAYRGTVTEPGRESPCRDRPAEESLALLARMRRGELPDGSCVLRAKIDMAAENMKMRDPLLYRIRREAEHYRRGREWPIYPLYDFAHGLSDAFEGITHSLCTLEFENNREIYDWLLAAAGIEDPPRQIEFARLALTYTVLSKRKLLQLVEEGGVAGWDDPRMPTLRGLRRRGCTPEAIRAFCDAVGVTKAQTVVDVGLLEHAIRDDLNAKAPRVLAVLRPLRVVVESWPEGRVETLDAPSFPREIPRPESRPLPFERVVYIERDDFSEAPPKGYKRLAPGRRVRLRHAYVVECREVVKDERGEIVELRCVHDAGSLDPGADAGRIAGTIHWAPASSALPAEVRLYDRLFADPEPDRGKGGPDFRSFLNPDSLRVVAGARVEPSLAGAAPGERFQFERHGYFAVDPDSTPERLVFNRIVALRDPWARRPAEPEKAAPAAARDQEAGKGEKPEKAIDVDDVAPAARERFRDLRDEHGLLPHEARTVAEDERYSRLFDEATAAGAVSRAAASWIANDLVRELRGRPSPTPLFDGAALAELVAMVEAGEVTTTAAREVFAAMVAGEGGPRAIVEARGLGALAGEAALAPHVESVLAAHPSQIEAYRAGKTALLGFFVGQVMKATAGRADAAAVQEMLAKRLG
ncbi:MAG TPA: glutamine--tRNA ligase/YqeY domain fusion protein [Thermoanaerobaculia bacterium]|nr:glutamine--tRNA ligase/YqeY domain fusion protein [Thermoanaerobaculia bacterium]